MSFNVVNSNDTTVAIDKVHAKFIKFALGVSKYTSNTAVFRELGQVPITNKAKRLALMYYHRLEKDITSNDYPLLSAAYKDMKEFNHPWLESVHSTLSEVGLGNLYNLSHTLKKSEFKKKIKSRLTDIAIQDINSQLVERSYLKDLVSFVKGSKFKQQSYINIVQSSSHRSMYAKIRTNGTRLSGNPYSNVVKVCDRCNVTCDFKHILLECQLNENRRKKYYNDVNTINPGFSNKSTLLQYKDIMNLNFRNLDEVDRGSMISLTLSFVDTIYKSID